MTLTFREALIQDIAALVTIEALSFPTPWTEGAFRNELLFNEYAYYLLIEEDGEVVGYAGIWFILDEGHVTNIAIHPSFRGKKYGEYLLKELLRRAKEKGAMHVTLEVRTSNLIAQNLYRKFEFQNGALRKKYYSDNGEDALVMWVDLS
ncbi:ribosomal protein S18-alanine N-acetyltransferase [Listeria sp. PSOL-1]|uniref:ribosomal protein S18-alanine N-acetyltransferase n=1 Tax=Listeria sp. PSOL-1 TaxID=1844999 RepID=UPI0013D0263F|nr:ribosomal protein S18-alanine N-acetyltransferase [Listeria sp. PSOL-1]